MEEGSQEGIDALMKELDAHTPRLVVIVTVITIIIFMTITDVVIDIVVVIIITTISMSGKMGRRHWGWKRTAGQRKGESSLFRKSLQIHLLS